MSAPEPTFTWVLNLDAELELEQPSYNPRAKVLSQLDHYGGGSRALLGPGDQLLPLAAPASGLQPARPSTLGATGSAPSLGRAWCPTPRALARLHQAGITPEPHPSVEVLRRVNHRRFACAIGGGLPHQSYIEQRAPLEALLGRRERAWLLKKPFGFAGRGQLRAFRELSPKEWSWIDAALKRGGLVVEPLVTPLLELSLHGFLWQNGRYELGRLCVQAVSDRGVFRQIRLANSGELSHHEELQLFERATQVAEALAQASYFGPFGIDAYRYRLGDEIGFCALSEINARYTMGFATGFPRPTQELRLDTNTLHDSF